MSKFDKLVKKILNGNSVSYDQAENILKLLGFDVRVKGSHHVFGKADYDKTVSIKRRSQLLSYQIRMLQEVLKNHGY